MSKHQDSKKKPETPPPAVIVPGALPAHLAAKMTASAGKGVSTDAADNIVPLIYVLQALSPQVNRKGQEYVQDAEVGDIWLRNSPQPIVNGEVGISFQPCYFSKAWVEWVPRDNGGGFVAQHADRPDDATEKQDAKNPNKTRWYRPNGNEVIETRYHAGLVYPPDNGTAQPYVIPFSSSGHTVSRQWMFLMNGKTLPTGEKAPSFACLYRLKTKERRNAAGQTWYVFEITDGGWVQTEEAFSAGEKLFAAFDSGVKAAEAPAVDGDHAAGDDEKTM